MHLGCFYSETPDEVVSELWDVRYGDTLYGAPDYELYVVVDECLTIPYKNFKGEKKMTKDLTVVSIEDAATKVTDINVVGNGDLFELICKASSNEQGWMKSTKAMEITGAGCVVQVTTQQRNPDGSYSVAEALTWVPDVGIALDENEQKCLAPLGEDGL